MACTEVFDDLRVATEDLSNIISRWASYSSIWLNLISRSTFPLHIGTNRSVFAVGNIEPTTGDGSWRPIDLSNALGTAGDAMDTPNEICTDSWTDVEWGFYEDTYGPEISQLRGPVICRKNLLFSHSPDLFYGAYLGELAKRAQREWERNLQFHHRRLSLKAIAATDFDSQFYAQEGLTNMTCPECELTQEMLEAVAARLIEDGATNPDQAGFIRWEESGPIFSLYIGMQQSQRILRQNSELRQDYRFGDPSTLIARIGATRVIGNFRHIINQRPVRYSCTDGDFTEVQPYIDAAGGDAPTKGSNQIINPSWRTALYEGADVLSPELFTSEIVPPQNSVAGLTFDPAANYMGDWKFIEGAYKWDTDCPDPNHDRARHFAEFIHAPRPNVAARFRYGFHIIFRRCTGTSFECTTCSS